MTDNTTDNTTDAPTPAGPADDTPDTGWAVYDETLERFTSGVFGTRKEANAAAKSAPSGHTTGVRSV